MLCRCHFLRHVIAVGTWRPLCSPHAYCAFPWGAGCRMRFYVTPLVQNALFRKVRFFSPAQTSSRLTKKRTLCVGPHVKTHSMVGEGCRMRLWIQRYRKLRFSVRRRSQNAPFRRVRFSSPAQTWHRLTEKHILYPPPHEKTHSVPHHDRRVRLSVRTRSQNASFC